MKIKIIKMDKVFFKGIGGLTLYPFILIRNDMSRQDTPILKYMYQNLINHEMIHIHQERELLVLPFYIWYLIEWCIRAYQYKSWNIGYRNISFEREAYKNDKNLDYLKSRKFFNFLKYL